VMKVVRLGRSARNAAGMKIRQPLATFTVKPRQCPGAGVGAAKRAHDTGTSLNIKSLVFTEDASGLVSHTVKPNFSLLGPKYGKLMPKIREVMATADQAAVSAKVAAGESVDLEVEGQTVSLLPEEMVVETATRRTSPCAEEAGTVVRGGYGLTEELIQEGLVRDLVRSIQNLRKESGFNVDDRNKPSTTTPVPRCRLPSRPHSVYIQQETWPTGLTETPDTESLAPVTIGGEEVGLRLEKVWDGCRTKSERGLARTVSGQSPHWAKILSGPSRTCNPMWSAAGWTPLCLPAAVEAST